MDSYGPPENCASSENFVHNVAEDAEGLERAKKNEFLTFLASERENRA